MMSAQLPKRFAAKGVALTAALAVAACGVINVDVDVYKGPLANHKDVHTEQTAVMAIGAKPLLTRLYDFLGRRTEKSSVNQNEINDIRNRKQYKELRGFVNEVLGLYGDIPNKSFVDLLAQADQQFGIAERRWAVLDDIGGSPSPRRNQTLRALKDSLEAAAQKPATGALARAYDMFLFPGKPATRRNWRDVIGQVEALHEGGGYSSAALGIDRLPDKKLPLYCDDKTCKSSSNAGYEALQNREMLRAQAKLLFAAGRAGDADRAGETDRKSDDRTEGRFVNEVADLAKSFTDTREAIDRLLILALRGLSISDTLVLHPTRGGQCVASDDLTPVGIEALRRQLALAEEVQKQCGADADPVRAKRRLIKTVAGFAAYLVQPQHLVLALESPVYASSANVKWFKVSLQNALGMQKYSTLVKSEFRKGDYQAVRNVVEGIIVDKPVEASKVLLAIHEASRFGAKPPSGVSTKVHAKFFVQAARWTFGIARGPVGGALERDDVRRFGRELLVVARGAGLFLRGRLAEGLDTLIEDYLKAAKAETLGRRTVGEPPVPDAEGRCPEPDKCGQEARRDEVERRRDLLLTALARFAEKVLFVVNHEILFELGATDDVAQGNYIGVLQSVGNSILVHVDAIRQEAEHAQMLRDRKGSEVRAIERAFGGQPGAMFGRFVGTLEAERADVFAAAGAATKELSDLQGKLAEAKVGQTQAQAAHATAVGRARTTTPPLNYQDKMNRYAATWLSLGGDPASIGQPGQVADTKDIEFRKNTLQTLSFPTPMNVVTALKRIGSEVRDQFRTAPRASQRQSRLFMAVNTIPGDPDFDREVKAAAPPPTDTASLLKAIDNAVLDIYGIEKRKVFAADNAHKKAMEAEKKAKDKLAKATAEVNTLTSEEMALDKKDQAAKGRKTRYENAAEIVPPKRTKVVEKAAMSKRTVVEILKEVLVEDRRKAPKGEQAKYDNALKVVAELPAPLGPPTGLGDYSDDALDVLDELIAELRHDQVRAKREGGAPARERAAAALVEAYRQRAGMIYLRPAMTYLRTSQTATTLQDNNLAWKNLLEESSYRTWVPFLPTWASKTDPKTRIATEIDKQFWQNVNRVRVAGGGFTNYVIAKDDVGNWYVKNMSTDITKIVNAARSLGMYAAGIPVVAPASAPTSASGDVATVKTAAEGVEARESTLTKQRRVFNEKFIAKAKDDLADARQSGVGVEERIMNAWRGITLSSKSTAPKDTVLAEMDKLLPKQPNRLEDLLTKNKAEKDADAPKVFAGALRQYKLYHDDLYAKVDSAQTSGLDPQDRRRYAAEVTKVVLAGTLKDLLARGKRTVSEYEIALEVIGSSVRQ